MHAQSNTQNLDTSLMHDDLRRLFNQQRLAVVSSVDVDQPYASLVAFAASPDLHRLYFATSPATRKYANLTGNPGAAMLMDNRSNQASDFRNAMAVTASGRVVEMPAGGGAEFKEAYLPKHPYLEDFINSPATAVFCLQVQTYYVVSRFQNVVELHVSQ